MDLCSMVESTQKSKPFNLLCCAVVCCFGSCMAPRVGTFGERGEKEGVVVTPLTAALEPGLAWIFDLMHLALRVKSDELFFRQRWFVGCIVFVFVFDSSVAFCLPPIAFTLPACETMTAQGVAGASRGV